MKKLIGKIKSINYKYFFQELIIVVAGILIALSLNSWREDTADKNREQYYLKSLKTDFEQSLASLNEIYNQNLKSDSNVKSLLMAISRNNTIISNDSAKTLLGGRLFGFNRFVPASGTYKEIISTGNLQILRNVELRIALSSWDDMILRNRQLEDVMFWQYHLINVPYLNKHIARSDLLQKPDGIMPGCGYRTDFKKLFADTEFENILINRRGALQEANDYMKIMIRQVEHIINLINKDIEE